MTRLKEMGTAQNVKIYRKHGVNNELFGVSFGNLKKLQKEVKKDHDLAIALWNTDNYEARIFATYIADPKEMTIKLANKWVESIEYYVLSEIYSSLIAKTPIWRELMDEWMKSDKEFVKSTGYYVFANVLKSKGSISDVEIKEQLILIKSNIHNESNRVKHTMNNAIIAIGIFRPEFQSEAIKAVKAIGKVEVDHGKTNCKTPDAIDYIQRTISRNNVRNKKN